MILCTFYSWRIQPLRQRAYPMWEYAGSGDVTCESPEELNELEVDARVQSVLDTRGLVGVGDQPTPLALGRSSTRVSLVFLPSSFVASRVRAPGSGAP